MIAETLAARTKPSPRNSSASSIGSTTVVSGSTGAAASRPTVNIEGLVGGLHRPRREDDSSAPGRRQLDLRLVPDMNADEALAALKAHLAKRGFGDIEVNMTGGYDPTNTRPCTTDPSATTVYRQEGIDPSPAPRSPGSWPGYVFTGEPVNLRRAFRHGPRQRRACAGRILRDRIQESRKSKTSTARRCRLLNISTNWRSNGQRQFMSPQTGIGLNPACPFSLRRRGATVASYSNFASRLICVPAKATETGQVFFVSSACSRNFASSIPGTSASVLRSIVVIFGPPPTISSFTVAVVLIRFAG